jgi:acyl-[acyl-carrier-protein]-phospholipid O-acyltransferase/long-chain-fatty-acid--[acyl-carrier-protein] ligase
MTAPIDRPSAQAEAACSVPLPPFPPGWTSLGRAFVLGARAHRGKVAMVDSLRASLTYGDLLVRSLALGRFLARETGGAKYVGIMVPPSVPAAVVNLSLALWGKVAVNLNYASGQPVVASAVEQCGITHVVTSHKVVAKVKLTPPGTLIYLEDVQSKITAADKAWAFFVAKFVPVSMLGRFLPGLRDERLSNVATVIFTSGSTGDPKGVVLSQQNILSNVHQVNTHLNLSVDEVVLGILPFFHSFGYTISIWTVLTLGKKVAYHSNPLDAKIVGELCETHKVTLMTATPTFMRSYIQRCKASQFASLVHLLLGAEKLKPELAREIRDSIHIEPLEGYGCTETSPVVSVNKPYPAVNFRGQTLAGNRPGTVGLLLPGTSVKTTHPDGGDAHDPGVEGMVHIKGPQVMVGYLNKPAETAAVLRDGWYRTGDLGYLDSDGFLHITGRLSRFSKIGGEMVPHEKVEAALINAIGRVDQTVAVTSIPDPKRGERLIVLYTDLGGTPEEISRKLQATDLPRLWLPSASDFRKVDEIPVLASGKIDLRGIQELAKAAVIPA